MLLPRDATKEYMEEQIRLCSRLGGKCSVENGQSALICFSSGLMEEAKRLVMAGGDNDVIDIVQVMIAEAVQTGMILARHFPEWSMLAVEGQREWSRTAGDTRPTLGDEIERGLMQAFVSLHSMEYINTEQNITQEKAANERSHLEEEGIDPAYEAAQAEAGQ